MSGLLSSGLSPRWARVIVILPWLLVVVSVVVVLLPFAYDIANQLALLIAIPATLLGGAAWLVCFWYYRWFVVVLAGALLSMLALIWFSLLTHQGQGFMQERTHYEHPNGLGVVYVEILGCFLDCIDAQQIVHSRQAGSWFMEYEFTLECGDQYPVQPEPIDAGFMVGCDRLDRLVTLGASQ